MAKNKPIPQNKAVVPWDEEMAKLAGDMGDARVTGGGSKSIGVSAGGFTVDGEDAGPEMDVVIIDHVNENRYYEDDYDPDNPANPVCFAFGRGAQKMAPHDLSESKQHETCEGCPKNAYGSAGGGRKGKACKNVVRLALITEGDLENVAEAEVRTLTVSATNVKNYNAFLAKIQSLGSGGKVLPCAAVCTMRVKPDKKRQIDLSFEIKEAIEDNEVRGALIKKVKEQIGKTEKPYEPFAEEEKEEAPPKNTKFTRNKR